MENEKQSGMASSKDIEVILDKAFCYDGFQVVHGEFFAHLNEPSFIFYRDCVSVNTACIRKLPDVEFIQVLVNPEKRQLAVLPCGEETRDSFRWCTQGKKRMPRHIPCHIFTAKVLALMGWNPDFKYKLLGKLIDTGNQMIFIFDLASPEIFISENADGKQGISRHASYPAEWQNQFGIPANDHQNSLQVSIFNGHVVFGIHEPSVTMQGKEVSTIE